jgi:hypothetical protein
MLALILILLTRILAAAAMYIFPVFGYFLTLIADGMDIWLMVMLDSAFSIHYNLIDKSLDFFTLTVAFIISLRFEKLQKKVCMLLFSWRAIGFFLFFFINNKFVFFLFPNIFENFFLFCLIQRKFFPDFKTTKRNIWLIFILCAIPKMIQEWILHASGNDMKIYGWIVETVQRLRL